MNERPVRVIVDDDLQRSRLTVFFRLLLAIPHIVWFVLWSIAAVFVAIVAWFVALASGTLADGLHRFLASYTRYVTQFFAYLSLTANPYPAFTGGSAYPVDVQIDPPRRQRRLTIALRLFFALPVLILIAVLVGGGSEGKDDDFSSEASAAGVVWVIAFLGWFASLVRGRMPLGFRNLNVYGLRVTAEGLAYLFLLTDRYPDADPRLPASFGAPPPHPVGLDVDDDLRRSRLTVFFRLLLAIPHIVWLVLWTVAAFFAGIAMWLATLVRGAPPQGLHRFLSAYVRYATHVGAYLGLVANPFPGFTGAAYPVRVHLDEPHPQSRWVTAFRILLAVPAAIVSSALGGLLVASAFLGWFAALATGRMPQSLRNAGAYVLRYSTQVNAYAWLLTDRYPFSGPPVREGVAGP